MSLLIKALANAAIEKQAQQAKRQAADLASVLTIAAMDTLPAVTQSAASIEDDSQQPELSLLELSLAEKSGLSRATLGTSSKFPPKDEPFAKKVETPFRVSGADVAQSVPLATPIEPDVLRTPSASSVDQAAAAKAFVKHPPAATSKYALVGLGLAGSLFLAIAVQGYVYFRDLSAADSVQLAPMPALPAVAATDAEALVAMPEMTHAGKPAIEPSTAIAEHTSHNNAVAELAETEADNVSKLSITAPAGTEKSSLKASNAATAGASTASPVDLTRPHSPLQLRSKKPLAAVDPTLLAAYQAFNRGEDAAAQQQYRQLLQHDVRNVDALLGMAAIAQRQGRDADAVGWYQALLEIEPRNISAQSALLSLQPTADAVSTGSRIKSMFVQQPETASLHAALGNVYAAQNQWTAAQEAYFNASQFAPDNADYAFNLAISLDQLGKSKLALQQYQRSLDLINSSAASSPDRAQLEARIQALQ